MGYVIVGVVLLGVGVFGAGALHALVGLVAVCLGVGDLVDQAEGGRR